MTTLQTIYKNKIITILRGFSREQLFCIVDALAKGGVRLVEVTFRPQGDVSETARDIDALKQRFGGQLLFGAGTVLTAQQLLAARDAGASYIISPNCDTALIQKTKALGLVSMPGAFTATEIFRAHQAGADIVKVFPADSVGAAYFKALRGPLANVPLAAVGGVDLKNIQAFFKAGVCCVGIGSNIADKKMIAAGNYSALAQLAGEYVQRV